MNAPLASWLRVRDHLSDDLFGGPRLLKASWVINLQKAGTLPFVLALLADHWAPWAVLAWVWLGVFLPNMLRKESRMARYPDWSEYRARSGLLLPRVGRAASPVVIAADPKKQAR